jgi:hypothetical protein
MAMKTLNLKLLSGPSFRWAFPAFLLLAACLILSAGSASSEAPVAHAQTPAKNQIKVPADDLGPPAPPAPPSGGAGPSIQFETLDHDWGTVLQGTVVEFTYKFRNTGSEVLRITNVKPG